MEAEEEEGSREFERQAPLVLFVYRVRVKSHCAAARRGCSFSTFPLQHCRCLSSSVAGGVESAAERIRGSDWDWWWKHWREARVEGDAGPNNQRRPATCRRQRCLKPSGLLRLLGRLSLYCRRVDQQQLPCQCSTGRPMCDKDATWCDGGQGACRDYGIVLRGIHFTQLSGHVRRVRIRARFAVVLGDLRASGIAACVSKCSSGFRCT